jgi:hypothetical protein
MTKKPSSTTATTASTTMSTVNLRSTGEPVARHVKQIGAISSPT